MENGTNGNGWKIFGIIASVLAGIWVIGSLIKGEWNPVKWFAPSPPEESDYEKCVRENKSKADNETCMTCVAKDTGAVSVQGTIRNGVCVPARTIIVEQPIAFPTGVQLKVTAVNGATVYTLTSAGNFVAPQHGQIIPNGTVINLQQLIEKTDNANVKYYQIATNGFIDPKDVSVTMAKNK
jgi:hypothetical protein